MRAAGHRRGGGGAGARPAGRGGTGRPDCGGLDNGLEDLECPPDTCVREGLAGGTVSTVRSPQDGPLGAGAFYYLERSDGSWVWFGQRNIVEGKGSAARPDFPLDDAGVRAC